MANEQKPASAAPAAKEKMMTEAEHKKALVSFQERLVNEPISINVSIGHRGGPTVAVEHLIPEVIITISGGDLARVHKIGRDLAETILAATK